jgi:hypothetical protein
MNKQYSFWFHYNKPASKAKGRNILTIHYRGKCILVEHIECWVPTETHNRKYQPRCVLRGKGVVSIIDNQAIITK